MNKLLEMANSKNLPVVDRNGANYIDLPITVTVNWIGFYWFSSLPTISDQGASIPAGDRYGRMEGDRVC